MKELIASMLLLMMSCIAFGQHVTESDKILVPRHWLRQGAADLERYDECKQEVELLKMSIGNYRSTNDKLVQFNNTLQDRVKELDWRWKEARAASDIADKKNAELVSALERDMRKQKRTSTFKGIAGAVMSALAAGALIHFLK